MVLVVLVMRRNRGRIVWLVRNLIEVDVGDECLLVEVAATRKPRSLNKDILVLLLSFLFVWNFTEEGKIASSPADWNENNKTKTKKKQQHVHETRYATAVGHGGSRRVSSRNERLAPPTATTATAATAAEISTTTTTTSTTTTTTEHNDGGAQNRSHATASTTSSETSLMESCIDILVHALRATNGLSIIV